MVNPVQSSKRGRPSNLPTHVQYFLDIYIATHQFVNINYLTTYIADHFGLDDISKKAYYFRVKRYVDYKQRVAVSVKIVNDKQIISNDVKISKCDMDKIAHITKYPVLLLENMKSVHIYCNIVIGQVKYCNGSSWQGGKFQDYFGRQYFHHNIPPEIHPKNQTTINLRRGGKLTFFKHFITPDRAKSLCQDIVSSDKLRQYTVRNGMYEEPLNHVLLSSMATSTGYRYHSVSMKAKPIASIPSIQQLGYEIARYQNLPQDEWKIGVDLLVYHNETKGIGFHSDDNQGENVIFTVVLDSPILLENGKTSRPVLVKSKGMMIGDEYFQIDACAGDAYVMNQQMQSQYLHAIPKKTTPLGRRIVLVFRNGITQTIKKDSGHAVFV